MRKIRLQIKEKQGFCQCIHFPLPDSRFEFRKTIYWKPYLLPDKVRMKRLIQGMLFMSHHKGLSKGEKQGFLESTGLTQGQSFLHLLGA